MSLFGSKKKEEVKQPVHQTFSVTNKDAEQELLDQCEQIALNPEHWKVIHLQAPQEIPENRIKSWNTEKLQILLTNQLPKAFAKTQKIYAYLLHDHNVVINVQHTHQKLEDLAEALFAIFYATQQGEGKITLYNAGTSLDEIIKYSKTTLDAVNLWRAEKERQENRQPTTAELLRIITAENSSEVLSERRKSRTEDILVVEDDKATGILIKTLLAQQNPRIAECGVDALKAYGERFPHIVFLDIGLPDISGLSVLKCIHEADPDAKVVMLTANSSEKNIKEAINHGAKGFIAKPFTREKLFAYIDKLL